ncbi:hypothetical protein AB0E75_30660 [Streptomyces griseoviridis]|uniref:Uncharacterized protein n=1 Tax=Streptomyces griseoviridis TaxID=45398 RepID=A0ABT9LRJ2_STRGD|nr:MULTISPECIES: hypothetical protein [Streptomyces]MDP9686156.1 hypothetical protein [Streptomyces griseoviridis]
MTKFGPPGTPAEDTEARDRTGPGPALPGRPAGERTAARRP